VNRRLDDAWNIKWVYPQLMTGPDLIRAVLEGAGGEDRARRESAVRAFIASQYHMDREVRFRQIELQNRLLDLFVDVPVGSPQSANTMADQQRNQRRFEKIANRIAVNSTAQSDVIAIRRWHERERPHVGGAGFLLHSDAQTWFRASF
jgi:hypothetical protein